MKAFGYVRLSQDGRDTSIEKQKESVRNYCREHEQLQLATTLNDGKNTSGFDSDRNQYQTLLNNIENENADAVVVRDRARLARDFDERLRLLTLLRETNCQYHVVEAGGRIELSDVQVAAMEAVHAAMDHAKKMAEIERAREVIENRVGNPEADLGRPRFGMEYSDDGLRQVPGDEFDKVQEILSLSDAGASLREIEDETGVAKSTVANVLERREWYVERDQQRSA